MLPVLSCNTSANVNGYRLKMEMYKLNDLWQLYCRMGVTLIEAQLINSFLSHLDIFGKHTTYCLKENSVSGS